MKYRVGIDLGTTSIGWAIINEDINKDNKESASSVSRIEDLGIRLFDSAEHQKDGSSLALPRRIARGARRRLARRKYRLNAIRNLFISEGLLTAEEIDNVLNSPNDPYKIRVKALDEKISAKELFIAVYHIAKRRGYKSNRKKIVDKDKETGRVLEAINKNAEMLKKYRTVGEMLHNSETKRNKKDSYELSVSREHLEEELKQIFAQQKYFNNSIYSPEFEKTIISIWSFQRPFAPAGKILELVGACSFENGSGERMIDGNLETTTQEKRAAKSTLSFQVFNAWQKINNLRIKEKNSNKEIPLTDEQKDLLFAEILFKKEYKYSQIRKALNLPEGQIFNFVNYHQSPTIRKEEGGDKKVKEKNPEDLRFVSMAPFYDIKKSIEESDEEYFVKIIKEVDAVNYSTVDAIAEVLTLQKDDEEIVKNLSELGVPENVIDSLLKLSFSGFGHLSLKALRNITPFLRKGEMYSKAVERAGYSFVRKGEGGKDKLPPLPANEYSITNPVVRRSISQAIKVINAIIDKYGSPVAIHIELARDLARDLPERRRVTKLQNQNAERNEKAKDFIKDAFPQHFTGREPGGVDILKYRLWKDQNCKCLYSLEAIDETRLFEDNYVEIDHIIPYSRSYDDSYNNKVLVLKKENQLKGNAIPYEYIAKDSERWQRVIAFLDGLAIHPKKKSNFKLKKYISDGFASRSLNDTRYAARFLKNYIEEHLVFAESDRKRKVITVSGSTTGYLRKRWGLTKIREESNLHHAMDAVIVAVTDSSLVQRVAHYSKMGEIRNYYNATRTIKDFDSGDDSSSISLEQIQEKKVAQHEKRTKNHFPAPWEGFRDELLIRTKDISEGLIIIEEQQAQKDRMIEELQSKVPSYRNLEDYSFVRPIFISKKPSRKITGRAHADTLRSPKLFGEEKSFMKKDLTEINLKDLENMRGKDSDQRLYRRLKERLELHGGNGEKAFAEPFYKEKKIITQDGVVKYVDGPQVKSIKIIDNSQRSGILINDGKALVEQDSMARIDIFSKLSKKGEKEFYVIPIYTYHFVRKELPNKVVKGKSQKSWEEIDGSYEFEFSLYKNDLLRIKKGKKDLFGYYSGFDRSTAAIHVTPHSAIKKIESNGVKTLESFEKWSVDILGNYHQVKNEKRQGIRRKK